MAPHLCASFVMVSVLAVANSFLFVLFQLVRRASEGTAHVVNSTVKFPGESKQKKLAKPFVGSLDCFTQLTAELFRTSLIMGFTFICEYYWYAPHSSKFYSRDLFCFILVLFFGYGCYTIQPIKDLSLLGREQTEEWKGWMQFIFLLYHYYHAEEVYNLVRVMITCYVWMTGFGNFSFFYLKHDYSWLRVAQMLWRLNFSVLLLMWTHSNTYILYYICPMHTFYFMMVYLTMYLQAQHNHSKWFIRLKLFALAVLIYIVWDINGGMFDFIFRFLGTDSVIGAKSGSVWEYYFRTSLDHYSSFLGMIFALNYPVAEQFFQKSRGDWSLVLTAVSMALLFLWWLLICYSLPKLSYNLSHSYFAIIPLTCYIFFRNITPWMRSFVSYSFHDLGKTTLETYLLQHHIWLTSNAKTLLTIVPHYPLINFAIATILFFYISKELYRLTMSLRGMIIPDDKNIAWRNCWGMVMLLSTVYVLSWVLNSLGFNSPLAIFSTGCAVAVLLLTVIRYMYPTVTEDIHFERISKIFALAAATLFILGTILAVAFPSLSVSISVPTVTTSGISTASLPTTTAMVTSAKQNVEALRNPLVAAECIRHISSGHWTRGDCGKADAGTLYCGSQSWLWNSPHNSSSLPTLDCGVTAMNVTNARSVLQHHFIRFVGDETIFAIFQQLVSLLTIENHTVTSLPSLLHADQHFEFKISSSDQHFHLLYQWAPYVENMTASLHQLQQDAPSSADEGFGVLILGTSIWNALYGANTVSYTHHLQRLSVMMQNKNTSHLGVWVQHPVLRGSEDTILQSYRDLIVSSSLKNAFHAVLDLEQMKLTSSTQSNGNFGGISVEIAAVCAQMVLNAIAIKSNAIPSGHAKKDNLAAAANEATVSRKKKSYEPRRTGSMSNPLLGLGLILISVVMLVTMDSFFGLGYLALLVCGIHLDWNEAYGPIHHKLVSHQSKLELADIISTNNSAGSSKTSTKALASGVQETDDAEKGFRETDQLLSSHE